MGKAQARQTTGNIQMCAEISSSGRSCLFNDISELGTMALGLFNLLLQGSEEE